MLDLGMGRDEVAVEFARRYKVRPRVAYRLAHGWTLQQAVERLNAHASEMGVDPEGRAPLSVAHLSEDAGRLPVTRQLLREASALAHECQDLTVTAWVLARRGEQRVQDGRIDEAIALSSAAGAMVERAPSAARAFVLTKKAMALSRSGDVGATERVLGEARDAFAQGGDRPEPQWMASYGWGHLLHDEALCQRNLGRGGEAVRAAERALTVGERVRFERPRAFTLGVLAIGHAQAGNIDQACATGQDLLSLASKLDSARVRGRVAELVNVLDGHRGQPAVRDLRESAALVLAGGI